MKIKTPSAKTRRYVYRIANAAVAYAAISGLVDGEKSAALLFLINAVLGLADVNVSDE